MADADTQTVVPEAAPARPEPQPPILGSGTAVGDGEGGWTWVPDPDATYADPPAWDLENGVRRKLTVAEATVIFPPPPTLDQLKTAKMAELVAAAAAAGQVSFVYDFGAAPTRLDDGAAGPAAGVKHLQMRATLEDDDQGNWKAVMPVAIAAVLAQSTDPFPIRVEENVTVLPTAQQVVACLTVAFARNSAIVVGTMPALKRAVTLAADAAAVAAVTWPVS